MIFRVICDCIHEGRAVVMESQDSVLVAGVLGSLGIGFWCWFLFCSKFGTNLENFIALREYILSHLRR